MELLRNFHKLTLFRNSEIFFKSIFIHRALSYGLVKMSTNPLNTLYSAMLTVKLMKFLTSTLLIFASFCCNSNGKLSSENEEIVRKWLPFYWLHSEEIFYPTNFDYYISQMQVRDANENVIDPKPTAETLIIGEESRDLHLNTINNISCVHCYDDVFFGLPVDQVSSK